MYRLALIALTLLFVVSTALSGRASSALQSGIALDRGLIIFRLWENDEHPKLLIDPTKIRFAILSSLNVPVDAGVRFVEERNGPGDGGRELNLRFAFNNTLLRSDMYTIKTTTEPGFVRDDATQQEASISAYPATFFEAPAPDRSPALVAGQQFLAASNASTPFDEQRKLEVTLISGNRSLTRTGLGLHPVTFIDADRSVSPARLQFRLLDGTLAEMHSDADATHLPGLQAVSTDAELRRITATFAGKDAWTRGTAALKCVSETGHGSIVTLSPDTRVHINALYRTAGYSAQFPGIGSDFSDRPSGFWSFDPILLDVSIPHATRFASESFEGPQPPRLDLCDTYVMSFSGAWDLERQFSLQSMRAANPAWNARTIASIMAGEVRRTMSKDMIAWAFGYPGAFGTVAQVRKLDTWTYDRSAPFGFAISFKNGTVAGYDPPGFLP